MQRNLSYVANATLKNDSLPEITIGGASYKGMNPQYQDVGGGRFLKTVKGVPFVRSTMKRQEINQFEIESSESIGADIEAAIAERIEEAE